MLFMVIEKYKDKETVYKRFKEKGRMMPDGVSYVNSWVSEDGNTCFQICASKIKQSDFRFCIIESDS